MEINGFAKGNGKVIHALVDNITICTLNQKKQKQMRKEEGLSLKQPICKKCQRMQLFKDFFNKGSKPELTKKSISELKKELDKKKENISQTPIESFTKKLIVWAIISPNSYKIVTSTNKHKPTPIRNEKLEFIAELNNIDEFNSITENGKLVGIITLQRLKDRFSEYNKKNIDGNVVKIEEIKKQPIQQQKNKNAIIDAKQENENNNDQSNIQVNTEEFLRKESGIIQQENHIIKQTNKKKEIKEPIKQEIRNKILQVIDNFANHSNNFIAKEKTNCNYVIIHNPTKQKFFDEISEDIIIQSLSILNSMNCQWDGKHTMPKDFISQCKLAMIAAHKTIGKEYPISLDISKTNKEEKINKKEIKIKKRKKKIKRLPLKIKRRIIKTFKIKRRK